MDAGSYKIVCADGDGNPLAEPPHTDPIKNPCTDPGDARAMDMYFGVLSTSPQPPPKAQSDLANAVGVTLNAVQQLYGADGSSQRVDRDRLFRLYFARLFRLAQLGLDGANVQTDIAKAALDRVAADLIDEEAGRIKNDHLRKLGKWASGFGALALLIYIVLCIIPKKFELFDLLNINQGWAESFAMLWAGCFLGVWLSYAIRTTNFTLKDLLITDSDRLLPPIRLIFAGTLSMILGVVFSLKIVSIQIGTWPISDIDRSPMLAFLVGTFFGISELLLPTIVAKRATDLVNSIK